GLRQVAVDALAVGTLEAHCLSHGFSSGAGVQTIQLRISGRSSLHHASSARPASGALEQVPRSVPRILTRSLPEHLRKRRCQRNDVVALTPQVAALSRMLLCSTIVPT